MRPEIQIRRDLLLQLAKGCGRSSTQAKRAAKKLSSSDPRSIELKTEATIWYSLSRQFFAQAQYLSQGENAHYEPQYTKHC